MSIGDFEKLSQIPGNVVGHCTSQGPQRKRTNRRYIERDLRDYQIKIIT